MPGFKGQADYSVDSKGRVALPVKMRRALNPDANGTFVITRGFEKCIFLYPMDRWQSMERELMELNQYQRESRDFVRTIVRWADDAALDGQGRVMLPKRLMDFAEIADKATIIGALDRIEIWSPELLEKHLEGPEDNYEMLAEKVMRKEDD